MAVIRSRGELQWQAIVRKKGFPDLVKTFLYQKDAERWAKQAELMIERGEIDQLDRTTQRTIFTEVIAEYKKVHLPTLARGGTSQLSILARIENKFGQLFLANLRPPAINTWLRELELEELSNQTIVHHINCLSGVVDFGRRHMSVHLADNPVKLVKRPKLEKSRDRRISPMELKWLFKAADTGLNHGLREMITLAIETSMRLSELLELEWERIDLKKCTAFLSDTKNGETRNVALSKLAVMTLKTMTGSKKIKVGLAAPASQNAPTAASKTKSSRVFHWKQSDSFQKTWKRCVERAQIDYYKDCIELKAKPVPNFLEDFRFHDLRHEATSRLFEKGLNPFEVASMTGHKSMQMLKRYTHVEAEKLALKLG